ncbi:MAG: nitroreductase [Clostridiaceae bacterium]|jgi:nitroreductase|nr:nitroreductase [Clostridiaceae bacterium]
MLDLLKQRRSIRKYQPQNIEEKKIESLKKSLLLAPSSRNLKHLQFMFIDNKEILEKISNCKPGASFLKGSALGIIVLGDESISDTWIEDASIASIIAQLEAEALGLGSCWIQIRNRKHDDDRTAEDYIREQLNIKENYRIENIISIGYKNETKQPRSEDDLDFSRIHINKF